MGPRAGLDGCRKHCLHWNLFSGQSSNKWRRRVFITSAKIVSFKILKGSVVSHMKASGRAVCLGFTVL